MLDDGHDEGENGSISREHYLPLGLTSSKIPWLAMSPGTNHRLLVGIAQDVGSWKIFQGSIAFAVDREVAKRMQELWSLVIM